MKKNYSDKFNQISSQTLYPFLSKKGQAFIKAIALEHKFSLQELRLFCEYFQDLYMWQEESLPEVYKRVEAQISTRLDQNKKKEILFKKLAEHMADLTQKEINYKNIKFKKKNKDLQIVQTASNKTIYGLCPVASDKTVCCNLKTIDVVENCAYGCSYCIIDTFYGNEITFDKNLKTKLNQIKLDPQKFYHFGTGQSSDALFWGNKFKILDHLCRFAENNPNILLEFKTKSDNIRYFIDSYIPQNIVLSWTLNTEKIINNEEHFTSSLSQRIKAAKKVSQQGIKVAFHFHPMVYYQDWQKEYETLVLKILKTFSPQDIAFISFGTLTFIKPVIKNIRKRGLKTKVLQMDMTYDPHKKLTYPDGIKMNLFSNIYSHFTPWHNDVYFYLCMERAVFWDALFGFHYPDKEDFEKDFGKHVFKKLRV